MTTVWSLLDMVVRRKLIILCFFLFAVAGGYAGLMVISPVYRASVQIIVNLGQDDVFMPVLPSSSSEVRTPLTTARVETRANSELRIIESEPLVAKVVEKFGPAGLFPGIDVRHLWYTPRGLVQVMVDFYRAISHHFYPQSAKESLEARAKRRLAQSIKTATAKDSTVIQISLDNSVPEIAADALNELVRLYLDERVELYKGATTAFFDTQLAKVMSDLHEVERKIEAFREDYKVQDLDIQREFTLRRLAEVNIIRQNETIAVEEIRRRIAVLDRQSGNGTGLGSVPSLLRIRDDLLRAQADLAPRVEAVTYWTRLRDELNETASVLTRAQSESVQLMQRQKVLQDTRKLYLQKVEETRMQQAMRDAHIAAVSVINWAVPDYSVVSPKLGMVMGGVAAVGIIGGIGLALLLGFLDDRIMTARDVAEASGLPVIGSIREMPASTLRPG